ncbi:hypothetical protein MA16_Dca008157 [Dendrobium catenatum]|uniref:Uncharacterized protein n=1 Tax=Dendrobium catenatum TaxID=906689 RepID=A0A2I0X9Y7_9ASPA|nr:hypothetical protein MA16_Dca008157 [Dendrobium catenatum]
MRQNTSNSPSTIESQSLQTSIIETEPSSLSQPANQNKEAKTIYNKLNKLRRKFLLTKASSLHCQHTDHDGNNGCPNGDAVDND